MIKRLSLSLFVVFFLLKVEAQLSDAQIKTIDELFKEWNQPNHPGGVVGIRKSDEDIFLKAYGLASLDYLVPNQPSTIFNIASVSKQFTAMGILLLERDGKLSVDDMISKYIPILTEIGDKVTIRHMLHHTSGIRSFHELLFYAGWRGNDLRTNEDIYRLMESQEDLNFEPGDQYMYCNTGYIYMAFIIEKITGEPFPDWMRQNVFLPLGMRDTYVEGDPSNVVPGNATSYYSRSEGVFQRAIDYWAYVGSGNVHATVADLLAWGENFYNPKAGWEKLFRRLETTDPFNDGSPNEYAFGVNVSKVKGKKVVAHGGSIGGFRSNFVVVPEEELVISILTNFNRANPGGRTFQVFDVVVDTNSTESEGNTESKAVKPIKLSAKTLKGFENYFWNAKDKYVRRIYVKNDTLMYWRNENSESKLVPIGKNTFKMLDAGNDNYRVLFDGKGKSARMMFQREDGSLIYSDRFVPTESTEAELKSYAGKYYSTELDVYYTFELKNDQLTWYHQRRGYGEVSRIKQDVLDTGEFIAEFDRDPSGIITGAKFSSGRVKNLRLVKVE